MKCFISFSENSGWYCWASFGISNTQIVSIKEAEVQFPDKDMLLYRQKLSQEENVRKILQPRQLFLQQQYNFSQFATFSSCNLYSKGSNRCLLLIGLLIDVSCLSVFSHTPYSTHPYPCLLFFRICLSQKKFFICTEWYTCIEWYTCNIIKQFLKQFVWWLKSGQSYLPWILGCFLTQGKNQLLFPFQEEGLCNSYL